MWKLLQYYGTYQSAKGVLGGMPGWARFVIFLVALPGIAAILLSILALLVSILALLLLTVPVYRLLKMLVSRTDDVEQDENSEFDEASDLPEGAEEFIEPAGMASPSSEVFEGAIAPPEPERPRRQIEVKIIE